MLIISRNKFGLLVNGKQFLEMSSFCETHPRKKIYRNAQQTPIEYICAECQEVYTRVSKPELFD